MKRFFSRLAAELVMRFAAAIGYEARPIIREQPKQHKDLDSLVADLNACEREVFNAIAVLGQAGYDVELVGGMGERRAKVTLRPQGTTP